MNDLVIVVPLGISTPGTPVVQYLKWGVNSLLNQKTNYNYKIVFACDDNVSNEVKEYLNTTGHDIQWYDSFYFFRKGGIWKKIYDQWKNYDCEYVAFMHYDDVWSDNKIQSQLDCIKSNKLEICWSSVKIIDSNNNIHTNDLAHREKLDKHSIRSDAPYAFSHSCILSKKSIFECGIYDYIDNASAIYESLFYIFSHKLIGGKDSNSCFYHRQHTYSVSNNLNKETEEISEIRKIANYSLSDVIGDANSIDIEKIISGINL